MCVLVDMKHCISSDINLYIFLFLGVFSGAEVLQHPYDATVVDIAFIL